MNLLATALTVAAFASLAPHAPDRLSSPTLPRWVQRSDEPREFGSGAHTMSFDRDGAVLSVPAAIPERLATLTDALTPRCRSSHRRRATRRG